MHQRKVLSFIDFHLFMFALSFFLILPTVTVASLLVFSFEWKHKNQVLKEMVGD